MRAAKAHRARGISWKISRERIFQIEKNAVVI
jgi:hypothetical protein